MTLYVRDGQHVDWDLPLNLKMEHGRCLKTCLLEATETPPVFDVVLRPCLDRFFHPSACIFRV